MATKPADTKTAAAPAADPTNTAPRSHRPPPKMGDTVIVQIKPGALLRNNETGGFFVEGDPTPQTVTVTLLRRLVDGDLILL